MTERLFGRDKRPHTPFYTDGWCKTILDPPEPLGKPLQFEQMNQALALETQGLVLPDSLARNTNLSGLSWSVFKKADNTDTIFAGFEHAPSAGDPEKATALVIIARNQFNESKDLRLTAFHNTGRLIEARYNTYKRQRLFWLGVSLQAQEAQLYAKAYPLQLIDPFPYNPHDKPSYTTEEMCRRLGQNTYLLPAYDGYSGTDNAHYPTLSGNTHIHALDTNVHTSNYFAGFGVFSGLGIRGEEITEVYNSGGCDRWGFPIKNWSIKFPMELIRLRKM